MKGTDSMKERGSAVSTNSLIIDNYNNQIPANEGLTSTKTTPQKSKKKSEFSSQQTPAQAPALRGAFGITRAATIIWYICIGILFLIAFIALILSILYFATNPTTEPIIKLYGICGAGSLTILTFAIIFLDCCNDGNRKEREEIAMYRMLQEKEAKQKALTMRWSQRKRNDKEEKLNSVTTQQPKAQGISNESDPQSQQRHLQPNHVHHYYPRYMHHHPSPLLFHNHPVIYPISTRPELIDIGVETSDKFLPVSKNRNTEHGTQTDRTEGTQTSTRDLNGIPSNVTEIIHERTILKAPRELLGTIKQSMAQQDRDLANNSDSVDANTLIAFV